MLRRLRRPGKLPDRAFSHVQLRELLTQVEKILNGLLALFGREAFGRMVSLLRRKHTHPDLFDPPAGRPELEKVLQISRSLHHLPRDRTMNDHLVAFDVLNDLLVSCRSSAGVMLGLKAVNGDH